MSDFTQNFLAGIQAGQAHVKAQQEHEKDLEDLDLRKKILKHQMNQYELESKIKQQEHDAKMAGEKQRFFTGADPVGADGAPMEQNPIVQFPGMAEGVRPVTGAQHKLDLEEAFRKQKEILTQEQEARSRAETERQLTVEREKARLRPPPQPHQPTEASIAMQAAGGDALKALQLMNQSKPGASGAGTGRKLSDAAITTLATSSAAQGGRVPIGLSRALSKEDINAIVERTAEIAGTDINKISAQFKADSSTLAQLTKNANAVDAFEATASKNITLLVDLAKKIPDTGMPILNQPIRFVATKLGNTDLPAFQKVLNSVNTEIARITNNPNLTGVMAEQARKDAEGAMTGEVSLGQLISSLHAAQLEMKNRKMSFHEQLFKLQNGIDDGLHTGPASTGQPQGFAAPAPAARPRAQSPDGKIVEFDGKSWVPVK